MTRTDKIVDLKRTKILYSINPFNCTEQELDRLLEIVDHDAKRIPRSADDYVFLNGLAKNKGLQKQIGKWS